MSFLMFWSFYQKAVTTHPFHSTLCLHTPTYYPKLNKFSIPFLRFPYIKSLILNKPCQSLNPWRLTNKLARENQHLLTQHFYFSHKAIALTRLNSNNQCFEFLQWTPSALSITWPTRDWLKHTTVVYYYHYYYWLNCRTGYSAIAPYYYYCYCYIERNVHQNSACSAGQQKPLSIELTARRLISKNFFAHALWHGWPSAILFSRTLHLSLSYFARKRVRKSVETLGIRTECFSNEWYGFMKP